MYKNAECKQFFKTCANIQNLEELQNVTIDLNLDKCLFKNAQEQERLYKGSKSLYQHNQKDWLKMAVIIFKHNHKDNYGK